MKLPPIDSDTDRRVRKAVIERVAEFSKDNMEYFVENMPGLKKMSGRERLAWYRLQPMEYWAALAAEFPRGDYSALALLRDYRDLSNEYGRLGEVVA